MGKILLIYPRSHGHLGLFTDLEGREDVVLCCSQLRPVRGWLMMFLQRIVNGRNINRYVHFPFKYWWYTHRNIFSIMEEISAVVMIDGALNNFQISDLRKMKRQNDSMKFYLYFINSIDASSALMIGIKRKFRRFPWDEIITFDSVDAKKYGLNYLGFSYYSKQDIPIITNPNYDVYYVGGNKGGRIGLIRNTFDYLQQNGVKCDFEISLSDNQQLPVENGMRYFRGGWKPYSNVLKNVMNSKCVLEFMQEGQNGATLRYFEAVCYNKKLLTDNPNITEFPYYDSRWMRVFKNVEDIDVNWLKENDEVDYQYKGDFSPVELVAYVQKKFSKDE